uniref:Uncharacterized protein n=1 Tax=Anguilla anguilla TaxID=7936 RepID=A0A0E9WEJ8_ANGAN
MLCKKLRKALWIRASAKFTLFRRAFRDCLFPIAGSENDQPHESPLAIC